MDDILFILGSPNNNMLVLGLIGRRVGWPGALKLLHIYVRKAVRDVRHLLMNMNYFYKHKWIWYRIKCIWQALLFVSV